MKIHPRYLLKVTYFSRLNQPGIDYENSLIVKKQIFFNGFETTLFD